MSVAGFSEKLGAILAFYFFTKTKMKWDELSYLKEEGRSEAEIDKLRIVLAFYDRLPSKAMQEELLSLMEVQPTMEPSEFNRRLDNFATKVKAATIPGEVNAYFSYAGSERVH